MCHKGLEGTEDRSPRQVATTGGAGLGERADMLAVDRFDAG